MPGEVDPRLLGLLQGVMGLADALRDAGSSGDVSVRLGRPDGLLLLQLVAGANDAEAESWSQRGRPRGSGFCSLKIAGVTFEWPEATASAAPAGARLFCAAPAAIGAASNQNVIPCYPAVHYGFEEEKPALR